MSFINKAKEATKNVLVRGAAVATVAASPMLARAQSTGTSSGPDFSSLTSSIDLATVITAVMAVAAAMVGVYIAIKGAKIVLRMVRGA
jgi:hypothetical protein